jgi:aspartyl-tRNA(Asn)/glutamyl-tRNA(Gln) amidotransferase subunit A
VPAYPPSPLRLLSHHGPIARTVGDAALMLRVLALPDHLDPYALPPEDCDWNAAIEAGVKGWRIAFSPDLGYARVDAPVAAAVAAAARQFEALGAVVEEVGPIFASPRDGLFTLWAAGLAALLRTFPDERKARPTRASSQMQRRAKRQVRSIGSRPTWCARHWVGKWCLPSAL